MMRPANCDHASVDRWHASCSEPLELFAATGTLQLQASQKALRLGVTLTIARALVDLAWRRRHVVPAKVLHIVPVAQLRVHVRAVQAVHRHLQGKYGNATVSLCAPCLTPAVRVAAATNCWC